MGSSTTTYAPWIKFWFWLALAPLSIVVGLYIAYIGIHDLGGREIYSALPSALEETTTFQEYEPPGFLGPSDEYIVFCKTSLDRGQLIQKIHEMGIAEIEINRKPVSLSRWQDFKMFFLGSSPKGEHYLVVPETWGYTFAILVL